MAKEQKKETTTTTTTQKVGVELKDILPGIKIRRTQSPGRGEPKISLNDFLDTVGGLSDGERLFYVKHYGGHPRSLNQWQTLINLARK